MILQLKILYNFLLKKLIYFRKTSRIFFCKKTWNKNVIII